MFTQLHFSRLLSEAALVLFLASFSSLAATTYYVDGQSGADSNAGTAPDAAWKTLAKVTASQNLLQPGDSILLRSGQTFTGPLVLQKSGTPELPITVSRYGDGEKPELTGFATAKNWKAVADGVWEAECPECVNAVNVVTVNGVMYPMGRWPNADAPNGGYLTVDSHVGKISITDAELPAEPNWTGAEVVIRKFRWVIDRNRITGHTGNTLTYQAASTYDGVDRHGYFIQNDPRTLDAFGEWYFNAEKKVLRVFFGKKEPEQCVVKAGAVENLIVARDQQHISFSGLKITGANGMALTIQGSTGISVRDCEIRWTGRNAIDGASIKKFTIEDCVISDTSNNAISFPNGVFNSIVRRVTIHNTAMAAGMGASGDSSYNAITMLHGNDNLIESFTITNTGYNPVHFSGSRVTVQNGFIDGFASVKDDSGGIYTWTGATDRTVYTDRKIIGNIILNSDGARAGAEGETKGFGIYLDDAAANIEVTGNTVAHTDGGIFLHNAHHTNISGNTFFDNDVQMLFIHDGIDPAAKAEIREVVSTENTLISRTPSQLVLTARSMTNDFAQFGTFERNIYARPLDQNLIIDHEVRDQRSQAYDLEGRQAVTGLDRTTRPSAVKLQPYTINDLGPNLVVNGDFKANVSDASCWTATNNSTITWMDGKLDGGALHHSYKAPSAKPTPTLLMVNARALKGGKHYVLRFSVLGTVNNGSASVRLRRARDPWDGLTSGQYVKVDTTRRECELVFKAPSDQPACYVEWSFNEGDGTLWLDNVTLQEASITELDRKFRLEYNRTNEPRSIPLEGEWVDVSGTVYSGNLTLPPRGSKVLIKQAP
ncbi:MAG TPA: right-handed parallel beta-helix repeat-containing protein [Planctomycetota bacterium]|nr:right-handed parallel beta-helix repeat-containing protein [Planctomycetota bacterium]